MHVEITEKRAKTIARAIQRRCKTAGSEIAYGQALDGLAEGLGLRDWNTLSAKLARAPQQAPAPNAAADRSRPAVPLRVTDRAGESAMLDAARMFMTMSDDELADSFELLDACGFCSDDPVYTIVEWLSGLPGHEDVAELLRDNPAYDPATLEPALDAVLDAEAAIRWLKDMRPSVHAALRQRGRLDAGQNHGPSVPGDVHTCDWRIEAAFDAAPALDDLSREDLRTLFRDLERCGYSDELEVDRLVEAVADLPENAEVRRALDHAADDDPVTRERVGFTATLDADKARAWLRARHPDLHAEMAAAGEIDARTDSDAASADPVSADPASADPASEDASRHANTEVAYLYRDADNYKATARVVLQGRISESDAAEIREALDEGEFFIPGQIGLADLQDSFVGCESRWDPEKDHPWHELGEIEPTDAEPTVELSARSFYLLMTETEWDPGYLPPFYEEMRARHDAWAAGEAARTPSTGESVDQALDALAGRGDGWHQLRLADGRTAYGYGFRDDQDQPALLLLHDLDGTMRLSGWREQPLGELDWREADKKVYDLAAQWGLKRPRKNPSPERPEAIAGTLDEAPLAVARYLSDPPSFHEGALEMKVFVAETARSYPARGYAYERPDGTIAPMGGAALPDGIAFDGVAAFATSTHDWEIAEGLLEAWMEDQGYTPYRS